MSAPINVSGISQVKDGSLGVNALAVFGDAILSGDDRYLNFGDTAGASGHGVRDNDGVIEYKSASGNWVPFPTCDTDGYILQWDQSISNGHV